MAVKMERERARVRARETDRQTDRQTDYTTVNVHLNLCLQPRPRPRPPRLGRSVVVTTRGIFFSPAAGLLRFCLRPTAVQQQQQITDKPCSNVPRIKV